MELRKRYGVQVPEEDYHRSSRPWQGCVDYLAPKLEGKSLSRSPAAPESDARPRAPPSSVCATTLLILGARHERAAAGIRLALAGRPCRAPERHYLWGGLNSFYKLAGRASTAACTR
jgi:hypothetical protein